MMPKVPKEQTIGWMVSEIYVMTKRMVERMDEEEGRGEKVLTPISELAADPTAPPFRYMGEVEGLQKALREAAEQLEESEAERGELQRGWDLAFRQVEELEQINEVHVKDKTAYRERIIELQAELADHYVKRRSEEDWQALIAQVNDLTRQRDALKADLTEVSGQLSTTVPITNEPLLGLATTEQMLRS